MLTRFFLAALAVIAIAGCASVPDGRGGSEARALAAERGVPSPPEAEAESLRDELLSRPLDAAAAVRLAMLGNPELRAAYARLGLSAAEIYTAGRVANPVLSASRLDSDERGALDQVTFGLSQSFTDLLLLADRSELARRDFARAQAEVAAKAFDTATAAARAWLDLALATELADVHAAAADAADTAAGLARRFFQAGNMNRLELADLQAQAAEAEIEALDARTAADRARAELGGLLGLPAGADWRVRRGLPAPLETLPDQSRLRREAADSRLDLLAARREVAALEHALGVTRRWRWLGELELEVETERETDGSRLTGAGLALELPLFNRHRDDLVRAESRLEAAYAQRDALATRASHEIALAEARLEASRRRIAALRDVALPEHRQGVEENLKRYNFMLTGVFDLLESRRAEYRAIARYLAAVHEHWLAHATLEEAVGSMIERTEESETVTAAALMGAGDPAGAPEGDHSRHGPHAHHHGGQNR